ncbi:MAG: rod shape-determining protein MreC [Halanaerobiales bacterium]|nr:rod shape-determining protein MreC [Halanaerobiales bacterium]
MKLSGGKKTWIILIIIIVLLSMGFLIWRGPIKETNFPKNVLSEFLRPFQKIVANVHHSVNEYFTLLTNLKEIQEENKSLSDQVEKLQLQMTDYNKIVLENNRLCKLLAFKELVPFKTVGAKVIGMTPNNWIQDIIIDRGYSDGIQEKMPVITYNGALVGQIKSVSANTATLVLLSEVNFAVGGRIEREESRAIGIVRGLAERQDMLLLDQIAWDTDIQEGDFVVTSGLTTSNFPMGIPIGEVIRIKEENFGAIQQAEIKPFLNLSPLEEVLIILEF